MHVNDTWHYYPRIYIVKIVKSDNRRKVYWWSSIFGQTNLFEVILVSGT